MIKSKATLQSMIEGSSNDGLQAFKKSTVYFFKFRVYQSLN